jgi:hypothetical protein
MGGSLTPDLEFTWVPTLLAAGVVVVVGLVANFVVGRPGWLGWGGVLGGIVASAASGHYDPSGNNAALGALLGLVVLTPILAPTRTLFVSQNTADVLFMSVALSIGWMIVTVMLFVPLGYISATLTDMTRKKVGGPVGY